MLSDGGNGKDAFGLIGKMCGIDFLGVERGLPLRKSPGTARGMAPFHNPPVAVRSVNLVLPLNCPRTGASAPQSGLASVRISDSVCSLVDEGGKAIRRLLATKYEPQSFATLQTEHPNQIRITFGAFYRWSKTGNFRKVLYSLSAKAGKSYTAIIDSTTFKVHKTAYSMHCDNEPRQIGRRAGGLTTKIHLIPNTEKMPLDFSLTGGKVNDTKESKALLFKNYFQIRALLGDKA